MFIALAVILGFVYVAGGIGFGTYAALLVAYLLWMVVWPIVAIVLAQRYIAPRS